MTISKNHHRKFKWMFILIIPIAVLLISWVIMLLWNAILPDVIPVKNINFGQAVGIFILSRILFGSFRNFPGYRRKSFIGAHLRERWMSMTDEEKENFRKAWKERCTGHGDPEEKEPAKP